MKSLNLIKTLYESYPYIVKVVPVMEKKVLAMGLSSGGIGGYNAEGICNLANAMLDMIDRKRQLEGIKRALDKVMQKLPKPYARIVIGYYLNSMPLGEIAKVEKTTYGRIRTRYNNALSDTKKILDSLGYTEERLVNIMKQEKWMRSLYEQRVTNTEKIKKSSRESCGIADYASSLHQKSNSSFGAFLAV